MLASLSPFRAVAALLVLVFAVSAVTTPVTQAGMIGTGDFAAGAAVEQQRAELRELLATDEVRGQLERWGVDPDDAAARVETLTPAELREMAQRMEEMPAGAGVSSVVNAIVLVFLVLLITDILGVTDVFPFVRRTVN